MSLEANLPMDQEQQIPHRSHFEPPPPPLTSKRYNTSMNGNENMARRRNSMTINTESFVKPRNGVFIAVPVGLQPAPSTMQVLQTRWRVSSATFHPDTTHVRNGFNCLQILPIKFLS